MMQVMRESHHIHHCSGFEGGHSTNQAGAFRKDGNIVFRHDNNTFFLMLQWQQTVHRYLRVLHSRMMKRPPKNVTMEDARKAHHMRWPLLSQGTSDENGMTTSSILEIKIEESGFILLMILLVLIELSLPWGTVPSASASIY